MSLRQDWGVPGAAGAGIWGFGAVEGSFGAAAEGRAGQSEAGPSDAGLQTLKARHTLRASPRLLQSDRGGTEKRTATEVKRWTTVSCLSL